MSKRIIVDSCSGCVKRNKLIKRYRAREIELLERIRYYKTMAKEAKEKSLVGTAVTLRDINKMRMLLNEITANIKKVGGKKQYHNYL